MGAVAAFLDRTGATVSAVFRTESLTRELTPQERQDLKRRRAAGEFGPPGNPALAVLLVALVVVVFLVIAAVNVFFLVATRSSELSLTRLLPVVAIAVGLLGATASLFRARRGGRQPWALLARFADDNGLRFRLRSANPNYPGCLFGLGHSRLSSNHLWSDTGLLADCGGYRYTTGSGDDRTVHRWNFVAFRLPRAMPHMLLDARANNLFGSSNLPVTFAGEQRLTLGAPFDDHYTLYAPQGYGQDAFYLFPPDLMSMLIDAPADFDIEIVDSWMFFYTESPLQLTDPATWTMLDRIQTTVGARLSEMATRYRDLRVSGPMPGELPPGTVADPGRPVAPIAEPGQRLRRGVDVRMLVIGALVVIGWILVQRLF